MISIMNICNGCGKYMQIQKEKINTIGIDLSNYIPINTGFILKEPKCDIHFCCSCYSQIIEGEMQVKSFGGTKVMRDRIKKLEKEKEIIKDEFDDYKRKISGLVVGSVL